MNYYETLYIIHPVLETGRLKDIIMNVESSLKKMGGDLLSVELWGKRKLSYFIDHLDLSSRMLSKTESLNTYFDYAKIENKLFDWIKLSKEYLTNSINKSGLIK